MKTKQGRTIITRVDRMFEELRNTPMTITSEPRKAHVNSIAYDLSDGALIKIPNQQRLGLNERAAIYDFKYGILGTIDDMMDEILERKTGRPLKNLMAGEKDEYNLLKKVYLKIMNMSLDNGGK